MCCHCDPKKKKAKKKLSDSEWVREREIGSDTGRNPSLCEIRHDLKVNKFELLWSAWLKTAEIKWNQLPIHFCCCCYYCCGCTKMSFLWHQIVSTILKTIFTNMKKEKMSTTVNTYKCTYTIWSSDIFVFKYYITSNPNLYSNCIYLLFIFPMGKNTTTIAVLLVSVREMVIWLRLRVQHGPTAMAKSWRSKINYESEFRHVLTKTTYPYHLHDFTHSHNGKQK